MLDDRDRANASSRLDFANQDLTDGDFTHRVLVGADFSGSNCTKCKFIGSDLSFARFDNANLYRADFSSAILYVTHFKDCDLTRARFCEAFLYGVKFVGAVNVTYADFHGLRLECHRRYTSGVSDEGASQEVEPLMHLPDIASHENPVGRTLRDLHGPKFHVGAHCVGFRDYKPHEPAVLRAQIYNRLKRVFRENYFYDEAGEYYYLERFWKTRTWYGEVAQREFRIRRDRLRWLRIASSVANELIWGYGERPIRLLALILVGVVLFASLYLSCFLATNGTSALLLSGSPVGGGSTSIWSAYRIATYYSVCIMTTVNCADIRPIGVCKAITAIEVCYGVVMFGLLAATIVRRLVRD